MCEERPDGNNCTGGWKEWTGRSWINVHGIQVVASEDWDGPKLLNQSSTGGVTGVAAALQQVIADDMRPGGYRIGETVVSLIDDKQSHKLQVGDRGRVVGPGTVPPQFGQVKTQQPLTTCLFPLIGD